MARRTLPGADQRYFLERHPPTKLRLIRWLAEGKEQRWCAERLDCSQEGVRDFARRHAQRIATVAEKLEDEFSGILYVKKAERLAMYEQTIELATKAISELIDAGRVAKLDEEGAEIGSEDVSDALARLERTRHRAARQLAEELGQLPSRMALIVESGKLRHEIVGIDPDKDL